MKNWRGAIANVLAEGLGEVGEMPRSPLSKANLRKWWDQGAHLPIEQRCAAVGAYVGIHLSLCPPKKPGPKIETKLAVDRAMTIIVMYLYRFQGKALDDGGENSAYAEIAEVFGYKDGRDVRRRVRAHVKRNLGLTPAEFRKFAKNFPDI